MAQKGCFFHYLPYACEHACEESNPKLTENDYKNVNLLCNHSTMSRGQGLI